MDRLKLLLQSQVYKSQKKFLNQYNPLPVGVARPGTKLFATEEGELCH